MVALGQGPPHSHRALVSAGHNTTRIRVGKRVLAELNKLLAEDPQRDLLAEDSPLPSLLGVTRVELVDAMHDGAYIHVCSASLGTPMLRP